MHSFSRSLLGLGGLTLAGCGAPAELDDSLFPSPNETGYTAQAGPVAGGNGGGAGGAPVTPPSNAGNSGGTGFPGGGGGNLGRGGSTPVASGGNGSISGGGSPPTGAGGQQGGGPQGGSSGGGGQAVGGCPEDISQLFARPAAQGGCDGGGCHGAGGTRPDLISPNVEDRLLNVISSCQGRPYIGADDSFLADKLVGNPPACGGFAMPFGMPQALSADDEQCILDWIEEVSGG